jgi:hypothetical protein
MTTRGSALRSKPAPRWVECEWRVLEELKHRRGLPRQIRSSAETKFRTTPNYGVYLNLLTYMYRVGPIVAMPPQVALFVPQALNKNGAETLGTASV